MEGLSLETQEQELGPGKRIIQTMLGSYPIRRLLGILLMGIGTSILILVIHVHYPFVTQFCNESGACGSFSMPWLGILCIAGGLKLAIKGIWLPHIVLEYG